MFEFPDIDPVAFSIWRLEVHWYGLMYVLGFLAGWLGLRWRARKPGSPIGPSEVEDLVFYVAVGVFVGGRIGYMLLYNLAGLVENPLSLFFVWQGGMSFHGGLLGVLIAMGLFARRRGHHYFTVADQVAPWIAPGIFFVRVGNFINAELWGRETDVPWAVIYQGEALHPSQLYEATLEGLVLFIVLLLYSAKPRPLMAVSALFLLLYGVFRFAVEFIRVPDNGIYIAWDWLTLGQIYTAPMIVGGIVLLVLAYRRPRRVEA
ncbi:MAG TPA: prolipoprotein diacylglyceryl transferase [Gammaproteobacteria bacterium]|nr:prolipoprotein diacylglyceryl transferase [Gammaproteobacteria bacterium]